MRFVFLMATAIATSAAPAAAQQQSDVAGYLCTFAGQCGAEAAEATPTKAAPATKGFRLAQSAPTKDAPETKGFRLATGAKPTAVRSAPDVRGFRLANPEAAARPARATPPRRQGLARARPMPAPGAGTAKPRANLMLTFDYNSAAMTPAAEAKARGFAQALMMDALKDKRFLIEGHTDARGARSVNIDLSRRRAQSVADFLIAQGVDRSRVEVRGAGPDEPLPGLSASAEENRRVEAVLLS